MRYFLEYETIKSYSQYVGQKFYWNRGVSGRSYPNPRERMNEFEITSYDESRLRFYYSYLHSGLKSCTTCENIFRDATFIDDE